MAETIVKRSEEVARKVQTEDMTFQDWCVELQKRREMGGMERVEVIRLGFGAGVRIRISR